MHVQRKASQFAAGAELTLLDRWKLEEAISSGARSRAAARHPSPVIGFLIAAAFGLLAWSAVAILLI